MKVLFRYQAQTKSSHRFRSEMHFNLQQLIRLHCYIITPISQARTLRQTG